MTFIAFRHRRGRPFAGTLPAALLAIGLLVPTEALPDQSPAQSQRSVTLAELAGSADFVGLAQVRDTDYLRRRGIPVSGSAYLAVQFSYKADRATALIEVYEKGLHAYECYFPNPTVFEEGRRYLVFLRRDPENAERYRGLPQGCALEVLVGQDNRYAVRMPPTGIDLARSQLDLLRDLARPIDFADPYAIVDDEALPPDQRDAMATAGQIVPYPPDDVPDDGGDGLEAPLPSSQSPPRQWIYTRGIPLEQIRELLQLVPALQKRLQPQPGTSLRE